MMNHDIEALEAIEELKQTVNELLDLVERPVGTFQARLPATPDSERKLIALFDAVGRTL